jgi:hypothetical protein
MPIPQYSYTKDTGTSWKVSFSEEDSKPKGTKECPPRSFVVLLR